MDVRKIVAYNLRRLRVSKLLSQEDLAVEASIDRTYMSRLERGLENPTVVVLDRLSTALECDIRELFRPVEAGELALKPLKKGRKKQV
jgi:transcriptional regulator with XRE-family HTH domain